MMICAVVGPQPLCFRFKYDEHNNGCKRLKKRIRDRIMLLYAQGVHRFYIIGSLGVGLWTGEIILRLKEQPEYSGIELFTVLPFAGHDMDWDARSQHRLSFLIQHSTQAVTVGTNAHPAAVNYHKCNEWIANSADCLLAVYDSSQDRRTGVGAIVRIAEQRGVPVTLIHPDTAVVSCLQNA